MSNYAHKGQILPLVNQMIPISKDTTFHASYDYGLHGFNQGKKIHPIGQERVLDFDGTSGYIEVEGVAELLHGTTEATLEMWVKKKSVQYGFVQLSGFTSTNGNLYPYTTNNVVYLDTFRTNRLGPITLPSTTTEWHHFAVTTKPGEKGWKLFQNGDIVYEFEGQSAVSTNYYGFEIGRNSGARYANALFADVRVWNYARSPEQIKENMNRTVSGGEPGLVSYHKMDERESLIAYDSSSNGFDGIWSGGIFSTEGNLIAEKGEGKFKSGVHVARATENIYGPVFPQGSWSGGSAFTVQEVVAAGKTWCRRLTRIDATNSYTTVNLPCQPNQEYTLSFYARKISGSANAKFNMYISDNTLSSHVYENCSLTSEFQRFSITTTTSAEATHLVRGGIHFGGYSEIGDVFEIADWQIEKGPHASPFTIGVRQDGQLRYPIDVMNYEEGTLSFWMKHPAKMPYFNGNANDAYVSTTTGYSATSSLVMAKSGAYDTRIFGIHWGGVNGSYLHCSDVLSAAPSFQPEEWNMITITWHKNVGYKYYINEVLIQDRRLDLGDTLMPFGAKELTFKNIVIDELRIEARQISDEEVAAWASSGLHYNYLDYSLYVD